MRPIDADALLNKKFKYMIHGCDYLLQAWRKKGENESESNQEKYIIGDCKDFS